MPDEEKGNSGSINFDDYNPAPIAMIVSDLQKSFNPAPIAQAAQQAPQHGNANANSGTGGNAPTSKPAGSGDKS